MSDMEVGEGFAAYLDTVDGGLDTFDGEAEPKAPAAKTAASGDPETKEGAGSEDESKSDPSAAQDTDETEAAASADDADTGDEESDDADAESVVIEGAELAGFLGLPESDVIITEDGAVLVKTQVDGVQSEVTLDALRKGYQTEANVTRKSQQVADERRELHERTTAQMQQLDGAIQQAQQMAEAMRGRTLAKYQSINWDDLRATNPGEFAATYTQMQQEIQSLDFEVQNLAQVRSEAVQRFEAERSQKHAQWVEQQRVAVFEQIPELAKEETRTPLLKEYQTYLNEVGFNDQEIQNILDSRQLRVINDAVRGRRAAAAAPKKGEPVPLAKKLSRVPRTLKAGSAAGSAKAPKRTNRNKAATRLKATGTDEDAARFAIESGLVDNML